MCRVLEVSRSGLYAWRRRARPSPREEREAELRGQIHDIHTASRGTYGSPRVHAELERQGVHAGKTRVERVMREEGLQGKVKRRFRTTTDSNHALPVAPNTLEREFDVAGPDQVWAGDITFISMASGGFLYLAVILDLFSRRVVGWALADHMRSELVLSALDMALGARVPAPDLLHHSDRGCQYASSAYRAKLAALGIQVSMSRRGNCYDNAVVESFNGTLKQELVHDARWTSYAEARAALHDYIEVFYNRRRLHSSLGNLSPADFEAARCAG